MDILEVSELVLKDAGHPLTSKEIMIAAQKKKIPSIKNQDSMGFYRSCLVCRYQEEKTKF